VSKKFGAFHFQSGALECDSVEHEGGSQEDAKTGPKKLVEDLQISWTSGKMTNVADNLFCSYQSHVLSTAVVISFVIAEFGVLALV
jgi:hypothetical protein